MKEVLVLRRVGREVLVILVEVSEEVGARLLVQLRVEEEALLWHIDLSPD